MRKSVISNDKFLNRSSPVAQLMNLFGSTFQKLHLQVFSKNSNSHNMRDKLTLANSACHFYLLVEEDSTSLLLKTEA